jgi:metal-responsive CopG/Arc/MetJ family transcriptional regulator
MARTIVDIPDALLTEVDALCKLLAISRAEATRQALKGFVRTHHNVNPDGFGLWREMAQPNATDNASADPG